MSDSNINRCFAGRCIMCISFLLLSITAGTAGAKGYSAGLERMARPELLPFLHPNGTQTKQFISYDSGGGNNDGSFINAFTKYVDENGEHVIFDEYGPGCLYRQQMNIWSSWDRGVRTVRGAGQARIKYYFDNETTARIDMSMDDFFGSNVSPFNKPLCFMDTGLSRREATRTKNRFAIQYYPFPFQRRLKVTVLPSFDWSGRWSTWYQYTYLAYPTSTNVTSWAGKAEDSDTIRRQWENSGKDPKNTHGNVSVTKTVAIANGSTQTILSLKGKGSVVSLKIHLRPFTKATFFDTNIKIYWDGSATSAVDLPLGYLFGGGGKEYECSDEVWQKTLTTLFFGFDKEKGSFYCYWPMPYWSSARIDIENKSGTDITSLGCDVRYKPSNVFDYPRRKTGYFCAKRTVDCDEAGEYRTKAFEENGRGHVVGITFFSDKYDMDGDEFTYIDDSRTPQIHGDGTEDDHNQGWGGGAYQKPLWGGLINGFQGAYRIYMNDCYVFYKNIKTYYEYSKLNKRLIKGGDTDVTIFYYKSLSGANLRLTDELDIGDLSSESSHNYKIYNQTWTQNLSGGYDGYERNLNHGLCSDDGKAFKGYSQFTVSIDADNKGVRLRKRINRADNGVQTANVFVDGKRVTERPWHIVTASKSPSKDFDCWLDSDFEIPASYTFGKSKITVKIEYVNSSKGELNEFYYWVYSYTG